MQRRTLLKLGAGSAALLTVVGGGLALIQPGLRQGRLSEVGRNVFAAVARAVLDGQLPAGDDDLRVALQAQVNRVDATIAGFPPAMQAEIGELVSILASAPGRWALTGLVPDWPAATTAELHAMMQGLRQSSLALRQQTYHALRDLTLGPYFADSVNWSAIAYPGPLKL